MSLAEIESPIDYVEPHEPGTSSLYKEQVDGIAERFFASINNPDLLAPGVSEFIAYFMVEDEANMGIRKELLEGLAWLSTDPESNCTLVDRPLPHNEGTIILISDTGTCLVQEAQCYPGGETFAYRYTVQRTPLHSV